MTILNLTQHAATADQLNAGVVEPADKRAVQALLTFEELPDAQDILRHAAALAEAARESGHPEAMIGGAPFFMAPLERALAKAGVSALYAFSKRESVEVQDEKTGEVRKTQVFKHAGFVVAVPAG
jgi:hypothetical protein